jgi:hypothetical protein
MANNSNPNNNQFLPLETFSEIPLDCLKINCNNYIQKILGENVYCVELFIYCPDKSLFYNYCSNRNYSEFKELFENFTKKNPNESLPEFPSRYTFSKKSEEVRMKYFDMFLNKILGLCKDQSKKEENFTLIYNLIFGYQDATINKITKEKLKEIFNDNTKDSINEEEDKRSVKSETKETATKKLNKIIIKNYSSDKLMTYDNNTSFEDDKDSKDSSSVNNDDNRSTDNNNLNSFRRNTLNYMNRKFNTFFNNRDSDLKSIINGIKKTITNEEKENSIIGDNNTWENIYVKTSLKDFSIHTLKIKERCLLLFNEEIYNDLTDIEEKIIIENNKDKDDNYYLIIPLYKINFEIFRLIYQPDHNNNKKSEKNNLKSIKQKLIEPSEIYELCSFCPNSLLHDVNSEIIIRLYHDYDRFETYIKFDLDSKINLVKNFLSKIEHNSYINQKKSLYINEVTESYMDSFGNIMVDVLNFNAPNFEGKIKIKIELEPYCLPTKTIMSNGIFTFNQKFILPKHNRFKYLKFYVYKLKEEGIFSKESTKLITSYEIPLPKLINIYFLNKNSINVKLKPIKEKAKKKLKYSNMSLNFRFEDYSTLLSLLVKNTNKRVLDDYPLYNKDGDSSEPYTIKILLKRIKRVLAMFKNVYSFYKMLMHFKYPILSSAFLFLVIFYTFFCNPGHILTHILIFLISILIFYSSVFQNHIFPKICPFFLNFRNKYDTPSKIAATESQKNKEEIAQNDYLIKKKGFSIPSFREIKEYKHAYDDLLFRLNRIASFCEKFKNLFIWTDPLLSLYMTGLLILFLLVVWNIEVRYIACFSILKKFIFGIFFYKHKLINNKEIARIVVTDAFNIWKKEKEKTKAKEKEKEKEKENEKEKKNENEVIKTMEKRALEDEKLKAILKAKLYEHSNIILDEKFYDNMETIGDIIEELGKVDDVLKIKRLSYLFHHTKNNSKIYKKDIDPEDIFAYFIQNIKSDYYRASNGFITTDYFSNEGIISDDLEIKNKNKKDSIPNDNENTDTDKVTTEK